LKKESNENATRIKKIDEMLVLINNGRDVARKIATLYDRADERGFGWRHLFRTFFSFGYPRRWMWNQVPQVNHRQMNRAQKMNQDLFNLLREIKHKGNEAKVGTVKFKPLNLLNLNQDTMVSTRGSINRDYKVVDSNRSQLTNLFGELNELEKRVKAIRRNIVQEL